MTDAPDNPYASPVSSAPPLGPAEEKQYSLLTHLLSIFFGFIPALLFFVLFKDRGPFVRAHTVTEWNFQLTVLIVQGIGMVLAFGSFFSAFASAADGSTSAPPGIGLFLVGYFLMLIVRVVAAIYGIIASVKANRGEYYRYPLAIRFVK
jgi:uncharacterized Tic20 family protein